MKNKIKLEDAQHQHYVLEIKNKKKTLLCKLDCWRMFAPSLYAVFFFFLIAHSGASFLLYAKKRL